MKRESGFYWVRERGKWSMSEWDANVSLWNLLGDEDRYDDTIFECIDEIKIPTRYNN